jgi:hypothetical protein
LIIKKIVDEVFQDYYKTSMLIAFPYCSFKCEKESGIVCCQNSSLAKSKSVNVPIKEIVNRYIKNDITKAIVCAGLEPFDSQDDLTELVTELRRLTSDDIVIYTGYNENEIDITNLTKFDNIIIKFGRFIPNSEPVYDNILGIYLQSKNQYAKKIS